MKTILVIALTLFVCACQPNVNFRGNPVLSDKIEEFVIGKTTASDVWEACGSPSLRRSNLIWIYIGGKSEEIAFKNVKIRDKIVVRMVFDEKGILQSMEKAKQNKDEIIFDKDTTDLVNSKTLKLESK